jgi:hypothetical protein
MRPLLAIFLAPMPLVIAARAVHARHKAQPTANPDQAHNPVFDGAVVALSAVLPVAQCEGALTDPASAPMAPRDTSYAFPLLWRGSYLRSQRRRNAKQSAEQ